MLRRFLKNYLSLFDDDADDVVDDDVDDDDVVDDVDVEQAGELLATFEMFEWSGCEGNNLVG